MLGKLKQMAGNGAAQKAVDKIAPSLNEHIEKIKSLDPEKVHDDAFFTETIIAPAQLAVASASGGVTSMIPGFKDKFANALLNLRNEIVQVADGKVTLVDDYQSKIAPALLAGLKQ